MSKLKGTKKIKRILKNFLAENGFGNFARRGSSPLPAGTERGRRPLLHPLQEEGGQEGGEAGGDTQGYHAVYRHRLL